MPKAESSVIYLHQVILFWKLVSKLEWCWTDTCHWWKYSSRKDTALQNHCWLSHYV